MNSKRKKLSWGYPPYKRDDYSGWVYDSKHNFVFELIHVTDRDQFIDYLNGNLVISPAPNSLYDDTLGKVYDEMGNTIILLRGWGRLTGIGGYSLSSEDARKVQDELGVELVNRLCGGEVVSI
jgi:hypothetical protein